MRGVSPVLREGVGNLPPAAARRLYPTLRPAAVSYGKDDAFQFGVHNHAQSGGHGQGRACEASEHLGSAAFVHQECQRRVRTHQGRKLTGAF